MEPVLTPTAAEALAGNPIEEYKRSSQQLRKRNITLLTYISLLAVAIRLCLLPLLSDDPTVYLLSTLAFISAFRLFNYFWGVRVAGIFLGLYTVISHFYDAITSNGFHYFNQISTVVMPVLCGMLGGPFAAGIATVAYCILYFVMLFLEWSGYPFPLPITYPGSRERQMAAMIFVDIMVAIIVPSYQKLSDSPVRKLEELANQTADANKSMLDAAKLARDSLAAVSHEVRTPLNVIHAMADSLARNLDDRAPDHLRVLVKLLQSSAQSLLLIANNVLDVSAISAGALIIERAAFDLRGLLQQIASTAGLVAAQKHISVQFECSSDVPSRVHGDEVRLRQILHNLIDFALRRAPMNTSIRLRVRLAAASPDAIEHMTIESVENVNVLFAVQDYGPPLPEGDRKRLFSRSPAAVPDAERPRSAALGLYIAHKLAKAMSGSVKLSSDSGSCTTALQLPFRLAGSPVAVHLQRLHILYADDDAGNQYVMRSALRHTDHTLEPVYNGEEAFHAFSARNFDIVLLDVEMPRMNGFEAAAAIRALEGRTRHTPIVFVSAASMSEAECAASGGDGILLKPYTTPQLLGALTSAVTCASAGRGPVPAPLLLPLVRSARPPLFRTGSSSEEKGRRSPSHEVGWGQWDTTEVTDAFGNTMSFLRGVQLLLTPAGLSKVNLMRYRAMVAMCVITSLIAGISLLITKFANVPSTLFFPVTLYLYPVLFLRSPRILHIYSPFQVLATRFVLGFSKAGFDTLGTHPVFLFILPHFAGCPTRISNMLVAAMITQSVSFYLMHLYGVQFPMPPTRDTLVYEHFLPFFQILLLVGLWTVWTEVVRERMYGMMFRALTQLERTRRKIERKRNAAEEFAAMVSFDLRTPLNVVVGITERLSTEPSLPVSARQTVVVMDTAAGMLLHIIGNMVDARNASEITLKPRNIEIRALVRRIVAMMAFYARVKQLRLIVRVGKLVPTNLMLDGGRLQQVLVNLVTNAVKFTEKGFVAVNIFVRGRPDTIEEYDASQLDTASLPPGMSSGMSTPGALSTEASPYNSQENIGLAAAAAAAPVAPLSAPLSAPSKVPSPISDIKRSTSDDRSVGRGSRLQRVPLLRHHQDRSVSAATGRRLSIDEGVDKQEVTRTRSLSLGAVAAAASDDESGRPTSPAVVDLYVQVEDSGPGLDSEQEKLLFSQFAAGISRNTRPQSGTGLGLYISQAIVEKMGSAITVKSFVGKGTTFEFDLRVPFQHSESDSSATTPGGHADTKHRQLHSEFGSASHESQRSLRLLVVEDAMEMQYVIHLFLRDTFHTIEMAYSGAEALIALEKKEFDVVLLDLHLPDMSGLETARRIRALERFGLRILVVTADASEHMRQSALAAGCDEFISKPLTRERLLRSLAAVEHDLLLRATVSTRASPVQASGSDDTLRGATELPPSPAHSAAQLTVDSSERRSSGSIGTNDGPGSGPGEQDLHRRLEQELSGGSPAALPLIRGSLTTPDGISGKGAVMGAGGLATYFLRRDMGISPHSEPNPIRNPLHVSQEAATPASIDQIGDVSVTSADMEDAIVAPGGMRSVRLSADGMLAADIKSPHHSAPPSLTSTPAVTPAATPTSGASHNPFNQVEPSVAAQSSPLVTVKHVLPGVSAPLSMDSTPNSPQVVSVVGSPSQPAARAAPAAVSVAAGVAPSAAADSPVALAAVAGSAPGIPTDEHVEIVLVPGPLFDFFNSDLLPRLRTDIVTMRTKLREGEIESVQKIAHRIKGSALTFGLKRVDVLSRKLMVSTDSPQMALWVDEMDAALRAAKYVEAEIDFD